METTFEFYRGDTYTRNFSLLWSKKITDVFFTVKKTSDDKKSLIHKRLGDGINLMDITDDGNVYLLTIEAEDTENMAVNTDYYFDIEVLSNNIKQTPIIGVLTLKEDYTRRKDEV